MLLKQREIHRVYNGEKVGVWELNNVTEGKREESRILCQCWNCVVYMRLQDDFRLERILPLVWSLRWKFCLLGLGG